MKLTLLGMVAVLGIVAAVVLVFLALPRPGWEGVVAEN
jgi:nitrogen fixation protein FixH